MITYNFTAHMHPTCSCTSHCSVHTRATSTHLNTFSPTNTHTCTPFSPHRTHICKHISVHTPRMHTVPYTTETLFNPQPAHNVLSTHRRIVYYAHADFQVRIASYTCRYHTCTCMYLWGGGGGGGGRTPF